MRKVIDFVEDWRVRNRFTKSQCWVMAVSLASVIVILCLIPWSYR
jgi:hypothetical protein